MSGFAVGPTSIAIVSLGLPSFFFFVKKAKRIGIEGTPSIYINGEKTFNNSTESLTKYIEQALKKI